jgi:hypothetical protein
VRNIKIFLARHGNRTAATPLTAPEDTDEEAAEVPS